MNGRIKYGDSKAIKITSDMKSKLDLFTQDCSLKTQLEKEISDLNQQLSQKDEEINALSTQANSGNKKEAKEANKKIKALEKEKNKISAGINDSQSKLQAIDNKLSAAKLDGITLKSISNMEVINNAPAAAMPDAQNIEQVIEPDPIFNAPVEESNENAPGAPAEQVAPVEPVQGMTAATPEASVDPVDLASELDFDAAVAVDNGPVDVPIINDTPQNNVDTSIFDALPDAEVAEKVEEVVETPEAENAEAVAATTEQAEAPEEAPIDLPIIDETTTEAPLIEEPTADNTEMPVVEENKTQEKADYSYKFLSDEALNKIWDQLKQTPIDKEEQKLETIEPIFISANDLPQVELADESENDLIKFDDYNSYVFDFGQNYYDKEALTPSEIDKLSDVDGFLNEDSFASKRSSQYSNVVLENNNLRDQIQKLDNDYKAIIENLTNEGIDKINTLNDVVKKNHDTIETKKAQIDQLEKSNKSLTDNVNKQDKEIEKLTNQNQELQETVTAQSNNITELESIKDQQIDTIKEFEERFDKIFDIVKDVDKGE